MYNRFFFGTKIHTMKYKWKENERKTTTMMMMTMGPINDWNGYITRRVNFCLWQHFNISTDWHVWTQKPFQSQILGFYVRPYETKSRKTHTRWARVRERDMPFPNVTHIQNSFGFQSEKFQTYRIAFENVKLICLLIIKIICSFHFNRHRWNSHWTIRTHRHQYASWQKFGIQMSTK